MLAGGGIFVWLADAYGLSWPAVFLAMAAVVFMVWSYVWNYKEAPLAKAYSNGEATSPKEVIRLLFSIMKRPHDQKVLLIVATYKFGEIMGDVMFKPFLVDKGFTNAEIGLWTGLYSMVFSIAGSLAGSWLADRMPLLNAITTCFFLRFVAQVSASAH